MNNLQQHRAGILPSRLMLKWAGVALLCLVSIGYYTSSYQPAISLVEGAGKQGVRFLISESRLLPQHELTRQKRDEHWLFPKDRTDPELSVIAASYDLPWTASVLFAHSISPHPYGFSTLYYPQSPRAPPISS